jgi:trimethylamine monooxygenase
MEYTAALVEETDYPSWDYEKTVAAFMEWEHNKHTDIMGFRDHSHTSAFTGTKAPIHHTKWSEALDDSMECYMKTKE